MPQMNGQHIDIFLTKASIQYKNSDYIAEKLAPPVMVQKESDKIVTYSQAMMFTPLESLRGDKAEANEVDWELGTPITYVAEEYALRGIVSDRERANADLPLQPDIDTQEFLDEQLLLSKEQRVANLLTNTANYLSSNHNALSGTSQWSDYTNSKPLNDIMTMQSQVFKTARKRANLIEIPYQVALTLSRHPDILELVKYTTNVLNMNNEIILPSSLFGMEVVIGAAGYNTAKKGQPASIDDIWGKNVIVAYNETSPKLKSLSLAKTFRVKKEVRKWRDDPRKGDVIEVSDLNTEMLLVNACGYLMQTVIA